MRNVTVSQHLAARTPTDTLRRPAVLFQKPARHWQRPTHKRCEAAAPSEGLTWCTIAGTQARPAWHHGTPTSDQRTARTHRKHRADCCAKACMRRLRRLHPCRDAPPTSQGA